MSRLPDFIIIGAGKCGTTSLQDYLNLHPQIYICPQIELNLIAVRGKSKGKK